MLMGVEDQQGSFCPSRTAAHPHAGSQSGLHVAGLDLFADLDLDALIGNAPTALLQSPALTPGMPGSAAAAHFAHSLLGTPARAAPAWQGMMAHQAAFQPGAVSTYIPQQAPAQAAALPFNIVVSPNPAISLARGSQPDLALMPSSSTWISTTAPAPALREPHSPCFQVSKLLGSVRAPKLLQRSMA